MRLVLLTGFKVLALFPDGGHLRASAIAAHIPARIEGKVPAGRHRYQGQWLPADRPRVDDCIAIFLESRAAYITQYG